MEDNSQRGGNPLENNEPVPVSNDKALVQPLFVYIPPGEFEDFDLDDGFDLNEDADAFQASSLLADLSENLPQPGSFLAEADYAPESASWWDDEEIILPDHEPLKYDHADDSRPENRLLAGVKVGISGQMWFVPVGDFPVKRGDKVLIGLEQGPALAEIISVINKNDEFSPPADDSEASSSSSLPLESSEALGVSRSVKVPHSDEELFKPKMISLASADDIALEAENRKTRLSALAYCKECIKKRELDMKLVDVEILHDRSKVIFYFTAPSRIDFRDLVKDLVRNYRTRIELRQIGVRNEAQMVGGVGNCGMVACCHQYLRKFAPVTIKMAKEQNLFLNPGKLSGMCGRLLCCLSFEQPNYEEFNRMIPKMGKKYRLESGLVKVLRANMFNMSVTVVDENNEETEISLDEWKDMQPRRADSVGQQAPQPHAPARSPEDSDDNANREEQEGRPRNNVRPDRSNHKPRRKRSKPRE